MLCEVANDRSPAPRERVAAGRALVSASKASLDAIRTATLIKRLGQDDDRFERANEVAQALREIVGRCRAASNGEAVDFETLDGENGHGP
jgi:hypothetical protein